MVLADDGLRSALDRLSASLDRIYGLLGELYSAQQQQAEPGHAGGRDRTRASVEVNSAGPDEPSPPRALSDEPRVVYGGGPSAFAAR